MKLIPIHHSNVISFYTSDTTTELSLPLAENGISAGFPSPAQDFLDLSIDLNKELVRNPSSTFYARVKGQSMQDMGIDNGDLVIIDKSLEPQNNKVAVCFLDGEFTMKRIKLEKNCCWLLPANKEYPPIKVTEENDFVIWGIVLHVIKSF